MKTSSGDYHERIATLRRFLLLIFLLGVVGATAELLLLDHIEDWRQWTPLALFLLSLLVLLCHAVALRAATLRIFQATMLLFIVSGAAGCWFHYQAKREFKLETNPDLAGWELFREAIISGTNPPVLAPGLMIQLGLSDPNIAAEKVLLELPHLNSVIVKGLIERRPFLSMTDLNAFLGQSLKKERLTELYGKMFIHVNLNTATREELLLIPGMGPRMAREFFEYRPYKSLDQFRREIGKYPYKNIEQFRKEIGKYVNAKEVARLERYVTLN